MELTMFQRLQELPLFQGLNMDDMNEIVTKVRLDFQQQSEEDTIVLQTSYCKKLIFILKGTARVEYIDPDNRFRLSEYIEAPQVLEPQSLFGMSQKYQRTYICQTVCQTLTIDRSQFLSVMMNYPIVKTNMLNFICNKLQRTNLKLTHISHENADIKFRQMLQNYSINPRGKKQIYATMDSLADMFCETRLNVSKMLKTLKDEGLITQERKAITILDLEKL